MDFISKANFERLRAQRPEVLAEISRRITGLIPSETERLRTTTATRQERQDPETGQTYTIQVGMGESDTPLEKYLVMILDLNGIETLPTLLELEAALNVIAPYQNIPASETDTTDDSDGAPQLRVAETANITHARVLSIVTALLLNENHAIFRNSEFYKRYESEYAAAYAHYASTGKLNERWQPDKSAPARTADLAGFLARRDESWDGSDNHFMMPYNAANRHEIVRLARRFLDEVSPADYVAAGAMAEKLRYR